jgi:hypothetical protein
MNLNRLSWALIVLAHADYLELPQVPIRVWSPPGSLAKRRRHQPRQGYTKFEFSSPIRPSKGHERGDAAGA